MKKAYKIILGIILILSGSLFLTGKKASTEIPTYVYLTNENTMVYQHMKSTSNIITNIQAGEHIFAKPVSKDWYYVVRSKGYVKAHQLDRQYGQFHVVSSAAKMPIYEQASTNSNQLISALNKSVIISYGPSKDGWRFMKYGNLFGYANNPVLKQPITKLANVQNNKGANLYLFASANEKVIATMPFNERVRMYSEVGKWTYITSKFGNGYILTADLTQKIAEPVEEPQEKAVQAKEDTKEASNQVTQEKQFTSKTEPEEKAVVAKVEQQEKAAIEKAEPQENRRAATPKVQEKQQPTNQETQVVQQPKQEAVTQGKKIALTFDDGPSAKVTPKVLNILKQHNVRATFFVLGQQVEQYPHIAKQIVNDGHQIAGHSWNHRDLSKLSIETVQADLMKTNEVIKTAAGVTPTAYRPPYGALNNSMRNHIAMRPILWTVDTLDWKHRNANQLLQAVQAGAKPGGNILMHDIHEATAAGLANVILYLKEQGYTFVTVDEL